MLIRTISLHPFAGMVDRDFSFSPGMNVVLGPNEAGKSTLVKALLTVLFESTKYGKIHWDKKLSDFVPQAGGDTFRVSLECESSGSSYRISKSWGGDKRGEVTLPTGQTISSAEQIDECIEGILNLKQGTWRNVLISKQAALSSTLSELDSDGEEANDLAQLLRSSAFETDGVSIERLGRSIDDTLDEMTSRWDSDRSGPENGRGVDNPWKKEVGSLLKAWYAHQGLVSKRERIEDFERKRDSNNATLAELTKERDSLEAHVREFLPIIESVKARSELQLLLEKSQQRENDLKAIQTAWPKNELELEQLQTVIKQHQAELASVEVEKEQARKFEKTTSIRERILSAEKEQGVLQQLEGEMKKYAHLSTEIFDALETAIVVRDRSVASLNAGKVHLRFTPSRACQVSVQKGLEGAEDHEVKEGAPLRISADGRIVLTCDDWTVDVETGDGGFATVQREYKTQLDDIQKRLEQIRVPTIEDARELRAEFNRDSKQLNDQRSKLDGVLNGRTLEELQAEVGSDAEPPKRSVDDLTQDVMKLQRELDKKEERKAELQDQIEEWKSEYTSCDEMLDVILEARQQRKEHEKKIGELPTVPEDIADLEAFASTFEEKKGRLQQIKEVELPEAKNDKTLLDASEPEQSTHELDEEIAEKQAKLELEKRRFAALQRVSDAFSNLKSELDSGTLDPWTDGLSQLIQKLTGGRYEHVNLDNATACQLSGVELPHELLSEGTRSTVGLALRLSMASHFLDGLHGFLVLDDPMVDLDPERQQLTAEVLKDFAKEKQVIVFTCHAAHAALLSDSPITLSRLV